jgi:hypothetical protein
MLASTRFFERTTAIASVSCARTRLFFVAAPLLVRFFVALARASLPTPSFGLAVTAPGSLPSAQLLVFLFCAQLISDTIFFETKNVEAA